MICFDFDCEYIIVSDEIDIEKCTPNQSTKSIELKYVFYQLETWFYSIRIRLNLALLLVCLTYICLFPYFLYHIQLYVNTLQTF